MSYLMIFYILLSLSGINSSEIVITHTAIKGFELKETIFASMKYNWTFRINTHQIFYDHTTIMMMQYMAQIVLEGLNLFSLLVLTVKRLSRYMNLYIIFIAPLSKMIEGKCSRQFRGNNSFRQCFIERIVNKVSQFIKDSLWKWYKSYQ